MLLYPPFPLKYHDPAKINASTSQCSVNYYQGLKNKNTDDPNYIVCNKKKKKKMRHITKGNRKKKKKREREEKNEMRVSTRNKRKQLGV